MAEGGEHRPQGVPALVGQLVVGGALCVVSWGMGSTSSQVKRLDDLVMWQQRTQTTLEMVCKQLEEKSAVDKRQDRELEQIRTHLRLPPP
jgi:hypothetical protein